MADTDSIIGAVTFQNFLLFIFVIIFTIIIGSFFNLLIRRMLKGKVKPIIYKTVSKIMMYSIYLIGFFFAFTKIINFNIPATLAALGILGITFLIPTIPLLQNIVAGIVLAIERPFKEEEIIEYNNMICKVKEVMLIKTRLRAIDGKIIKRAVMSAKIFFMIDSPFVCSKQITAVARL